MTLKLNKYQLEELDQLSEGECIVVSYKGIDAFLVKDRYGGAEYHGNRFFLGFYNLYEFKIEEDK